SPTALALADAVPYEGCEVMIVRPDGSRRTVLFYVTPIVAAATPDAKLDSPQADSPQADSPQADAPQVDAPHTGRPSTVVGATTILIDVTDREADYREAQAALRESEANFRGFFD